jgi:hypothetical protein
VEALGKASFKSELLKNNIRWLIFKTYIYYDEGDDTL